MRRSSPGANDPACPNDPRPVVNDFFRFPHTPHLAWLGAGEPRDDKVLASDDVRNLLAGEVVVEEKVDGANLGISVGVDGQLRAQNRGQYLAEPYPGQFARLTHWLSVHRETLLPVLQQQGMILFGEWLAARHSLAYDRLPDWFVVFDVYERGAQRFWSSLRRNALAGQLGLSHVPQLARGHFALTDLQRLLQAHSSRYRDGPMEGVVVRRESPRWVEARAKLVRADFTQAIGEHWRKRALEWNRLGGCG